MSRRAAVLGGAGFLGSHVAERLVHEGWEVTVIDGLLPRTGGREENLRSFRDRITLHRASVEDLPDLPAILGASQLIVDSMAWTAHAEGMKDPLTDLRLNAASHLHAIKAIGWGPRRVVLLGSRGQYGNVREAVITEDTPMVPLDVQGVHKVAAESYYRIYGALQGFSVVSLRLPNCFGERQLKGGGDIGLVGFFIRDLLAGKALDVYRGGRRRNLAHGPDVADIVSRLATCDLPAFTAFNVAGHPVSIEALAERLAAAIGAGQVSLRDAPPEAARGEVGAALLDESRLQAAIGPLAPTDLDTALRRTIAYFKDEDR